MATLQDLRHSAISDFDAFLNRLRGLQPSQWEAATPNKGWQVRHLAAHLAATTDMLNAALASIVEPVSESTRLQGDPVTDASDFEDIAASLTINCNALAATLSEMTDADMDKPAPGDNQGFPATGAFYANITACEIGLHLYDLLASVDHGSAGLGEAAIEAADATFCTSMVMIASASESTPEMPLAFHLAGRTIDRWVGFDGTEWTTDIDTSLPVTTIHADDTALVLFATGRIPDTDSRLSITGDASAFKTWIPGP